MSAVGSVASAVSAAITAVGTYIAANATAIATGALVGGTVGGVSSVAMGGNFWQGFASGAIGGAVFAAAMPGLSILSDQLARGVSIGWGKFGPLTAEAAGLSNVVSSAFAGAVSGAAVGAHTRSDIGRTALLGGIVSGGIAFMRETALWMRRKMVAQSKLDSRNSSGKSVGFNGDGFKLGGNRFDPNDPYWLLRPSPLGGLQGGQGQIFGIPYQVGSFWDRLVESYAGPHDFLNSWAYDPITGNIRNLNFIEKLVGKFSNPANVALATPLVVASVTPAVFRSAGAIIYGQSLERREGR